MQPPTIPRTQTSDSMTDAPIDAKGSPHVMIGPVAVPSYNPRTLPKQVQPASTSYRAQYTAMHTPNAHQTGCFLLGSGALLTALALTLHVAGNELTPLRTHWSSLPPAATTNDPLTMPMWNGTRSPQFLQADAIAPTDDLEQLSRVPPRRHMPLTDVGPDSPVTRVNSSHQHGYAVLQEGTLAPGRYLSLIHI